MLFHPFLRTLTATGAFLIIAGCEQQAPSIENTAADTTTSPPTQVYPGGMTLLESIEKIDDEVIIPYKKFRLPNGLTVILHEDNSDPLVHVDVTYHVGSGREEVGRSGFAHFFEHMMFQGSENVADEQHFKIISESGGTLNGTTNTDRTNYFETAPSNQLEKMLWLEADRMGFLLDAVTQEKFEVQRETVKNERGQRIDNAPYGLLGERVGEAMYPEGHPYSWSVIGYLEDLDRANLDDLKRFFLRWYGPNNAALTIGGRFDEHQTLEMIAKYFGSIPAGPEVKKPEALPVSLDSDRYISLEDNVSLPLVHMSWPTVHGRHPDEPALDVLNSILGDGRTSLLYKNLVKGGLAVQIQAGHGCQELHCTFTMLALPNPASGKSLADMEAIMRASLDEFETRGVQDDDLIRVKSSIISSLIFGLESVSRKVSQLAAYETFTGNPSYIQKEVASYENVTKDDVIRVYNQYIKNKPAVIMSIVPKDQNIPLASTDTWQRYERNIPDSPDTSELALRIAKDNFDRSIQPSASDENLSIKLPVIWRAQLSNNVPILGAINDETPTTAISLRINVGQKSEPLEKLGLAEMTAQMMNEATLQSTNEDLSNRLDKLGSSISFSSDNTFTTMTIRSLTVNLNETLAIAAEKLLEPKFDLEDFNRLQGQTIQGLEFAKTQPANTASAIYNQILYGQNNAISFPNDGTSSTVPAITLDDVKAFYTNHYSATIGSIIAVSNLSESDMTERLNIFSTWQEKPVASSTLNPFPNIDKTILYLIDKPGAAQSEIRMGKRALTYDATGEYYRSGLMNFSLGGAFNSRININLREDKGYTYGARSGFRGTKDTGSYTAQAGVRTDVTSESIIEFLKEIDAYRQSGITAEELNFTKSAIGQSDARRYETPFQKLGFLSNILTYDLPDGFIDQRNEILANLSINEVNALASKHLNTDDMVIVVVGDKATILPGLNELGYDIVELDTDGNPIN